MEIRFFACCQPQNCFSKQNQITCMRFKDVGRFAMHFKNTPIGMLMAKIEETSRKKDQLDAEFKMQTMEAQASKWKITRRNVKLSYRI